VDMVLLRRHTVVREHHWKNRSLGESFSQQPLAARSEMLNDNKGRTVVSRQSGQQFGNGLKVVCRGSTGYDRRCIHLLLTKGFEALPSSVGYARSGLLAKPLHASPPIAG